MQRLIFLAVLAAAAPAMANDVDPFGFEKQSASSMTRDEAIAKSKVAAPVMMRIDDQGRLITAPSTKSRAQVAAETQAAARLGLIRHGELGPMEATPAQDAAIRSAGLQAIGQSGSTE